MTLFRSIGARPDSGGVGTAAIDWRKTLEGFFTQPGVLPGADSPLVHGSPSDFMYWVNKGTFVTRRTTGDGVHVFGNDGAVSVSTAVAPGAGLQRWDVIWVRQRSNGENGDTTSVPEFGVTSSTASASPNVPAIPAGALELARNLMTASATNTSGVGNTITNTAPVAEFVRATSTSPTASLTAASNFAVQSGSPAVRLRDGYVWVEPGRLARTTALTISSTETRYALTAAMPAEYRPAAEVTVASIAHFGNGIPRPVEVHFMTSGVVEFRSTVTGTLAGGAADWVQIPPAFWPAQ